MITAVFTDNSDYARATGLWQWDYGQRLRIEGLKLPTAVEIHFALAEFAGNAITRVGTTKNGVTEVVIPESLLENQAAGTTYEIYAWIYLADKTSGETIKRICLQVKCRPKPEAFDTPGDAEIFRDAIAQVNASADRAETAREGAEAAKKAAEAAAGKIEGEIAAAGQIAEQVRQDAAAVAKDKQAVSQMVTETAQNAQKATQFEQTAQNMRLHLLDRLRSRLWGQFPQKERNRPQQLLQREKNRSQQCSRQSHRQSVTLLPKAEEVQAVTTEGDTQTKRVQDAATGLVPGDKIWLAAGKWWLAILSGTRKVCYR